MDQQLKHRLPGATRDGGALGGRAQAQILALDSPGRLPRQPTGEPSVRGQLDKAGQGLI